MHDRDHRIKLDYQDFIEALANALASSVPARAAFATLKPAKPSCEFAHPQMRALFFPESHPVGGPPVAGASSAVASPTAPGGAAASSHSPDPSVGAKRTIAQSGPASPRSIILLDWENAQRALDPLKAFASERGPSVEVLVFIGRLCAPPAAPCDPCNVAQAATDSKEAADSFLTFRAGQLDATLPPSVGIYVVCGSELRYPELIAQLERSGRPARLLRFKSDVSGSDAVVEFRKDLDALDSEL